MPKRKAIKAKEVTGTINRKSEEIVEFNEYEQELPPDFYEKPEFPTDPEQELPPEGYEAVPYAQMEIRRYKNFIEIEITFNRE